MASNLVCALVGESVTLLARCGFSQEEALAALACLPAGPARALYRAASVALVDLARKKHPDRDYQPVTDLLEKGSNP